MQVNIHENAEDVGEAVAKQIFAGFVAAQKSGRNYLLGCPSGRTPKPIIAALANFIATENTDLSTLVLVMMDDYVEEVGTSYQFVSMDEHFSCRRFAEREIVAVLNGSLARSKQIKAGNVWFPDPRQSVQYDDQIAAAGGVDLFLLASGASDGHVAFNQPSCQRNGKSQVVALSESTRQDNLKTFPRFSSLEEVPLFGVTVGAGTIADLSKSAIMVLLGESKRLAFKKITEAAHFDTSWPSSIILECRNPALYADKVAADAV